MAIRGRGVAYASSRYGKATGEKVKTASALESDEGKLKRLWSARKRADLNSTQGDKEYHLSEGMFSSGTRTVQVIRCCS